MGVFYGLPQRLREAHLNLQYVVLHKPPMLWGGCFDTLTCCAIINLAKYGAEAPVHLVGRVIHLYSIHRVVSTSTHRA